MNLRAPFILAVTALLFALAPISAWGILHCSGDVNAANSEVTSATVMSLAGQPGRRDWTRSEKRPLQLEAPSRKMSFHFPENLDPNREDFVLLFYWGPEVTPDTVRQSRLSGLATLLQFQFDPTAEVGGVALVGTLSHEQIASVIPSDRRILGGVRYHKGQKKNSTIFKELSGELVETLFFDVEI